MQKITPVDIQHKTFKKALQGYDRTDVDQFLDDVIEQLEDDAHQRAALQAEIADLKERISHFKAMEESLQNTLILAQRTADETKASAHKEADLIREQARVAADKEVAHHNESIGEVRREHQRAIEACEKAKSEFRSLLMTHMALLEKATLPGLATDTLAKSAPAVQPTLITSEDATPELALETSPDETPSGDTQRITVY
ncbi:MAG: DivIVA domain-containing protein, partial [Casimicrobiaceae bacterium]